jgi:hypothetical protein
MLSKKPKNAPLRSSRLRLVRRNSIVVGLGAIIVFLALLGAGIGADAAGLSDSSKALYGFAASIFGVVVGLLGGEKLAS